MNLGQAVAICLYELIRDGKGAGKSAKQTLATGGDIERITALLADVLSTSSYMLPQRAAETEQRIRRMVRRIKLSAQDVEAWLGILRHVQWQLRQEKRTPTDTDPSEFFLNTKSFTLQIKCLTGSSARASPAPSAALGWSSNAK